MKGRIDERDYLLANLPRDFAPGKEWPWVKAIGYSVRVTRYADGTVSEEMRYYLSTCKRTLGNNLSWLRWFAVTLLKRPPDKDSLRGKMMSCMIDTDYITQVLALQPL